MADARPSARSRRLGAQICPPYPPDWQEREQGQRRLPPSQTLADSYLSQRTRVWLPTGPADLAPAVGKAPDEPPLRLPLWVISAWNYNGWPTTVADNQTATRALRDALRAAGLPVHEAASVAADGSWAEESFLVRTWQPAKEIVALAARFGQPAVLRHDERGRHVVPTGLAADLRPRSTPGWAVTAARTTCPMRLPNTTDGRCENPGGPWVGRSMEVGLVWQAHRDLLARLLGCSLCRNGDVPPLGTGTPIGLTSLAVSSRAGGWQFGGAVRG